MFIRLYLLKFILPVLFVSFSGCYGDINVKCDFQAPGNYDNDSSNLYFFHSSEVYRPPKGISAFPDGGRPKMLFKKVTFNRYNPEQRLLETIFDYGSLPLSSGRWKFHLLVRNDTVTFMIEPVSGWANELKWGLDSCWYSKFRYLCTYETTNGTIKLSESAGNEFISVPSVPISVMKGLTEDLKYSDWGLIRAEIFYSGKRKIVKDLTKLKGNQEYRNAAVEILRSELTKEEKSDIIKGIRNYLDGLGDYERQQKKELAERTIERLLFSD